MHSAGLVHGRPWKVMRIPRRQGQTWSVDALLAVLVFVLAIFVFVYFLLFSSNTNVIEQLQSESELLSLRLSSNTPNSSDSFAFIINNRVDKERVVELAGRASTSSDYENLRAELGIRNDFCIYFEDKDGNLVSVSGETDDVIGIGNPDFVISPNENPNENIYCRTVPTP